MPWKSDPDVISAIVSALVILLSGLIAIATRLGAGQKFSWLWFGTQLAGAVLAGYLMWDAYPYMTFLPEWCTKPVMMSLAAHYGGKIFPMAEYLICKKFNLPQGN